jgi:hypothetical protein
MTDNQLKTTGWVVLIAAVVLSLVLGINANLAKPAPAGEPAPVLVGEQAVTTLRADTIYANTLLRSLGSAHVVGALTANSVNVTTSLTTSADLSTRNITATGTLSTSGVSSLYGVTANSLSVTNDVNARNITATGTLSVAGSAAFGASNFYSAMNVDANVDADSFSTAGNIDMTTMNNTGVNPVTINDDLVVTGTLSLTGATFTGPIKYGYVPSQSSGAAITHGFATTPTTCLVSADAAITPTIGTINETTFTVTVGTTGPVYWMCGQ